MISPENVSSGTDLVKVMLHWAGGLSTVSPSNGELLSKALWAKAGDPPKAKRPKKRPKKRRGKKSVGLNPEAILCFIDLDLPIRKA
jgi:hypothetical protein